MIRTISRQMKIVLSMGAGVAYIIGFIVLYAFFHNGTAAAALLPTAITGLLLGWRAGLLAGLLAFPVNTILFNVVGVPGWDAVFRVGGGPGAVLIVLAGVGFGWLRDLNQRLQTEITQRKEAEAALRHDRDLLQEMKATQEEDQRRTERALRRRAKELTMLHTTLLDIGQLSDVDILLETIVARAAQLIDAPSGGLYLYDAPDRGMKQRIVGYNLPAHYPRIIIRYQEENASALHIEPRFCRSSLEDISEQESDEDAFTAVLGAPMTWRGRIIGMLNVIRENERFSRQDLEILSLFADQAAIAIEKTYLVEAERQRAEEAETLRQAGTAIIESLPRREAITRILEQLQRVVAYDSASVQLLRDGHLKIVAGRGWAEPEDDVVGIRFPIPGDNPNTVVVEEQRTYILGDAPAAFPAFSREPHNHIRSWLGVPLIVRNQVIGMLAVDSTEPACFTESHAQLVEAFAGHVAIALENRRLIQSERRRAEEAEALRAANLALTQRLDLDTVLHTLLENLRALIPYDSASVLLRERGSSRVTVRALHGYEAWTDPELTSGVTFDSETYPHFRRMVATQESFVINDTHTFDGWIQDMPGTEHVRNWLGVPLVAGGEVIGFYGLDKTEPGFFTADHRRLAEMLAGQAAVAIKNARLFETERRRRSVLEQLRRVSLQLTSTLTLAPVLDAVLDAILALTSYKNAHIFLYDDETLTFGAAILEGERRDKPISEPRPNGLTYTVARTGETTVISSVDEHPLFQEWQWGGAIAAFPLRIGEEVVGVINVAYYTPQTFDEDEIQVLRLLADKAAVAIHNARLFEQTEMALARTEALYEIARSLITLERSADVLHVVVDQAAEALTADRVLLAVLDQSARVVKHFVVGGPDRDAMTPTSYEELMDGLTGYVMRTCEPVSSPKASIPDPRESPTVQQQREATDAGAICVAPLRYRDTIFGTMTVVNRLHQDDFDKDDLSLLEAIANLAAIALENVRLFDEIERLATTDELTALHNRRHLFELAERECARARRTGRPLAAMMLDIDRFKQVNDTYGHKVGDEVLRAVARRLEGCLRQEDILGRYGGEEFVVILPETGRATARTIAQRLLAGVRDEKIPTAHGPVSVTMSIGVAVSEDPPDPMTLVDEADAALYAAKRAGRNRVMLHQTEQ